MHLSAIVTNLEVELQLSHPTGNAEGFLKCSWPDVLAFHYLELRYAANQLAHIPNAADFMRYRPVLVVVTNSGLAVTLIDLSPE